MVFLIVYIKLSYTEDIVLFIAFLFYIEYLALGSFFYIIAEPIKVLSYYS